jgi:hypothetical protein
MDKWDGWVLEVEPTKAAVAMLLFSCCVMGLAEQQRSSSLVNEPDVPSTLSGQLIYHNGIRKWFELKLDRAQFGQGSIQLVSWGQDWKQIQVLRGCRVRSKGPVFLSPLGDYHYSLKTTQSVQHIESVATCTLKPLIQVGPMERPDKSVRDYRVDMRVNNSPGDHPVVFRVTSAGKELQPSASYASYHLEPWTSYVSPRLPGGSALYGTCGEGFVIDEVFGTPQASPSHLTESRDSLDMAMFNLERAVSSGNTDLQLGYTCVRRP